MTTIANPVTRPLAVIFSVNDGFINRSIDGLSEDELWHRPSEQTNPMLWMLGHIVHTRGSLLRMLGDDFRTGWGNKFQRGAVIEDRAAYPTLSEIENFRTETSKRIATRLAEAGDDLLSQEATYNLPGCKILADQIGFLALHEAYHVGQMAYVRKMLGHRGIIG